MSKTRIIVAAMLGTALALATTACHNKDSVPANNAVAPTPVPLTVSGQVVDATSGLALAGATVRFTRAGGASVGTLTSDAAGAFSLDATGLTDTKLYVSASAAGYGHASAVATLDVANNTTSVAKLALTAFTATPVTAAPGGASGSTAGSGEAENTAPVTVTIPAGAVPTSTPLTLSALRVDRVPLIPNADTQVLLGAFNLGPDATAFAASVQVTVPLPVTLTAGTQLGILRLDGATDKWVLLTPVATVNAGGVTATASVTSGGTFGLALSGITTALTASSALEAPSALALTNPAPAGVEADVMAALTIPAPPAPVSLTSGSAKVNGVELWNFTLTQTGTLPFTATFIANWISALGGALGNATLPATLTVVFPNLKALGLVDSAGRQIAPPGGVVPGRYTYTVTFAYTTKTMFTVTISGSPTRFSSAWSLTATETRTALTQNGVLSWGAFTGITGGN